MVSPSKADVMAVLAHVPDPEIPVVSVVDLGIVRDLRDGSPPSLIITPTYTGCPATAVIERMIREALDEAGYQAIRIETELSPPWTTDWISAEGREKLRAYGIDPPAASAAPGAMNARCPRCASERTEMISRFGSTPCKALHRCMDCLEPFDKFKCH
jgi:ring-1,2-phenylacetyl-CoA epoxidase subunit PaaD